MWVGLGDCRGLLLGFGDFDGDFGADGLVEGAGEAVRLAVPEGDGDVLADAVDVAVAVVGPPVLSETFAPFEPLPDWPGSALPVGEAAGRNVAAEPLGGPGLSPPLRPTKPTAATATTARPPRMSGARRLPRPRSSSSCPERRPWRRLPAASGGAGSHTALIAGPCSDGASGPAVGISSAEP